MTHHAPPATLLTLERCFPAPPPFVFALWSNPGLVSSWWGPEGHHLATCDMDLRPGGHWRFNMRRDGADHWTHGVYHEVVPDERLLFSYHFDAFDVHSIVSVRLAPEGAGTRLHFLQTGFPDAGHLAGHRGGWSSTFDILEDLLLKLHGIGSVYPTLPPARVSAVAADLAEARRRHDDALSADRAP
jgi:uncharacterized protein YndB with AHSA1/START domain